VTDLSAENSLFKGLEDDEETGHDEQQSDGSDKHAADSAYTERTIAIGAYACGKSQR
jgi:hypothetical protein